MTECCPKKASVSLSVRAVTLFVFLWVFFHCSSIECCIKLTFAGRGWSKINLAAFCVQGIPWSGRRNDPAGWRHRRCPAVSKSNRCKQQGSNRSAGFPNASHAVTVCSNDSPVWFHNCPWLQRLVQQALEMVHLSQNSNLVKEIANRLHTYILACNIFTVYHSPYFLGEVFMNLKWSG